jgi:CheY-like chemotaxis protein
VEDLPARIRAAIEVESGGELPLDGRHVLVVDDDRRNIFAIASVLEGHGTIVSFAHSGAEAMRVLEERPVDLVLMDVRMPEMDGHAATSLIRADPRFAALPVIAVTGRALEEDRDRCIAAGASDYLAKPIDADRLVDKIRMWLRA